MKLSRKVTAVIAALFAVATGAAAADMKFEMADVHPSPHSSTQQAFVRSGFYRGGRYQVRSGTMVDLIALAYGMDNDKVMMGPNWRGFQKPFRYSCHAAPANAQTGGYKDDAPGAACRAFQPQAS